MAVAVETVVPVHAQIEQAIDTGYSFGAQGSTRMSDAVWILGMDRQLAEATIEHVRKECPGLRAQIHRSRRYHLCADVLLTWG